MKHEKVIGMDSRSLISEKSFGSFEIKLVKIKPIRKEDFRIFSAPSNSKNISRKKPSPTLDTIRMIEDTIKDNNRKYSKTELWQKLPRKVMYQTYKVGLDYLMDSNKIALNSHKVTWIYYPEIFKKLLEKTVNAESK